MMAREYNRTCDNDAVPGVSRPPRRSLQFVDVHCHCLPYLDDGPESMEEAVALCQTLVEDNVSTVVATPHHQLRAGEPGMEADRIRRATRLLNRELQERDIDLAVLPGAEVRVHERIDELLATEKILTLADRGRHILLELPWEVLIDIEPLLVQLACRNVHPILAHPERNVPLLRHPETLRRWLACGVSLQVTAASLMGDWGRKVKRAAWSLLAEEGAVLVATDAHDPASYPPRMTAAFHQIAGWLGREAAHLFCVDNPARVIAGDRPVLLGVRR